nr:hypothetical protein OG461_01890 [Streptomyces sp. NBC_00995]
MKFCLGVSRRTTLTATALAAFAASIVPGAVSAAAEESVAAPAGGSQTRAAARSENWGVIARNSIGSPVAALRNGPFGSYGVTGDAGKPPYGEGSLGIQVADHATSQSNPAEKVDFGNEVDFFGAEVLRLDRVGFHVFQTTENVSAGGNRNLPGIRIEIDPNIGTTVTDNYSVMVWQPPAVPLTSLNRSSQYIDATKTGTWFLTGGETSCTQAAPCDFKGIKNSLDDGGDKPTALTVAVSKGRDYQWAGAVDGLRINEYIYDFEAGGVNARRAR